MNDEAINKILRYLDELDDDFGDSRVDDLIFEDRSFSRWATFEILDRLMNHPFDQAENVIFEFMLQTGAYANMHDDRRFLIASSTAEDILGLFSFERGNR